MGEEPDKAKILKSYKHMYLIVGAFFSLSVIVIW